MLPYRTIEDQIAGVVLTFVNVTDIKQAEQSLRESEERLSTIFNQAAVGQAEIALDGRFLRVNDELCRILGRPRETLLAANVNEVTHPDDLPEYTSAWEKIITTGETTSLDKRYLRPDGTVVPANSSLSRLSISGQPQEHTILAVTMDLSQRKESAAALEKSRAELLHSLEETTQARAAAERADKTKDEFLAVLSHELRTPLTPVLMAVQSVAGDPEVPESCREIFAMIERNVLLETYLIDDLLDITRISRGKMVVTKTPLDLHDTIRKALDICLTDFAAKSQRVHVALEASDYQVAGDAVRLQQVFWNLLKNACKFTNVDGEIWVRSRNENGRIIIEVTDTGIGIESDKLPDIFYAFKQANSTIVRQFGGLGLGLAISKATISAHSGELKAASNGQGRGSTFTVELPVTQPSA
jgi:two-component system CheB/CheR fusion protein